MVTDIVWKSEQQLYGAIYTVPDGMMVKGVFVRKDWAKLQESLLTQTKGGLTMNTSMCAVSSQMFLKSTTAFPTAARAVRLTRF